MSSYSSGSSLLTNGESPVTFGGQYGEEEEEKDDEDTNEQLVVVPVQPQQIARMLDRLERIENLISELLDELSDTRPGIEE